MVSERVNSSLLELRCQPFDSGTQGAVDDASSTAATTAADDATTAAAATGAGATTAAVTNGGETLLVVRCCCWSAWGSRPGRMTTASFINEFNEVHQCREVCLFLVTARLGLPLFLWPPLVLGLGIDAGIIIVVRLTAVIVTFRAVFAGGI